MRRAPVPAVAAGIVRTQGLRLQPYDRLGQAQERTLVQGHPRARHGGNVKHVREQINTLALHMGLQTQLNGRQRRLRQRSSGSRAAARLAAYR